MIIISFNILFLFSDLFEFQIQVNRGQQQFSLNQNYKIKCFILNLTLRRLHHNIRLLANIKFTIRQSTNILRHMICASCTSHRPGEEFGDWHAYTSVSLQDIDVCRIPMSVQEDLIEFQKFLSSLFIYFCAGAHANMCSCKPWHWQLATNFKGGVFFEFHC